MIEQKTPPEPDALDRQSSTHRKTVRNRRLGGIALGVVVVVVVTFAVISLRDGDDGAAPTDTTAPVDTVDPREPRVPGYRDR